MKLVLGLSGYARVGKDTAKETIVQVAASRGLRVKTLAMAEALRNLVSFVNPFVVESNDYYNNLVEKYGYEEAKGKPGVRDVLVKFGAGVRETIGGNTWLDAVSNSILRLQDDYDLFVISDVRYPNEAKMVQSMNGKVILISRMGIEAANPHEKETVSSIVPDEFIFNDDSLEAFMETTAQLAKRLIEAR
jgi:hypothetical protein